MKKKATTHASTASMIASNIDVSSDV